MSDEDPKQGLLTSLHLTQNKSSIKSIPLRAKPAGEFIEISHKKNHPPVY